MHNKKNILIFGISGMLGSTLFRYFSKSECYATFGTVRSQKIRSIFPETLSLNIILGVNAENTDSCISAFNIAKPDIVINCIGIVKQLAAANDIFSSLPINSIFPHRLSMLCKLANARLIHISTDCVFSGKNGDYSETDEPDALDLYGRSKLLGEVIDDHSITLRTSIIGHEIGEAHSLINWFLNQRGDVHGYRRAIFSGLPTIELASVIEHCVISNPNLRGLYHVSANAISKFDLLELVKNVYNKTDINIISCDRVAIDRSLNSSRFRDATGFVPNGWIDMLENMKKFSLFK